MFLHFITIADEDEFEMTVETEGASVVVHNQERDDCMMDETSLCYDLDHIDNDVICVDTMKYMTGERVYCSTRFSVIDSDVTVR